MKSNRAENWRELIAEQQSSERSIRAFCKQRGISEQSFYVWRRRLAGRRAARFVELKVIASPVPGSAIELILATGDRLRIANGVDSATLRLVLEALRP